MGHLAIDSCSEGPLGKKNNNGNLRLILSSVLSASWQCSFTSLLVGWERLLAACGHSGGGSVSCPVPWLDVQPLHTHTLSHPSLLPCAWVHRPARNSLHVPRAVKPCLVPGTLGEMRFQEWRLPLQIPSTAQFHGCKEPKGWGKGLQGALLGLCLARESNPALWQSCSVEKGGRALLVDSDCYFIPAGKGELWPGPSPSVIIINMK